MRIEKEVTDTVVEYICDICKSVRKEHNLTKCVLCSKDICYYSTCMKGTIYPISLQYVDGGRLCIVCSDIVQPLKKTAQTLIDEHEIKMKDLYKEFLRIKKEFSRSNQE